MYRFALPTLAVCAVIVGHSSAAVAAPVWVGDMETADLSQWSYLINPEIGGMTYADASTEMVVQGEYAARIELHNDAVWPNGLKRVELQHGPEPARTAEGATTWFAWSFYLPEVLPVDPTQQIGYWESNTSFQQMMAFEVSGERISFSTRRPDNVVQWEQDGAVTAGEWHRIAMSIAWSKQVATGSVDVWFDGEQVVFAAAAQTLADDNPHFTQIGLLRGQVEFADVPVIYIDDAVEGDAIEDVHPDLEPDGGTSTGGGETGGSDESGEPPGDSSGDPADGGSATIGMTDPDATTATTAATTTSDGDTGSTGSGADDEGGGGCGCRTAAPGLWGLALLGVIRRRRRS